MSFFDTKTNYTQLMRNVLPTISHRRKQGWKGAMVPKVQNRVKPVKTHKKTSSINNIVNPLTVQGFNRPLLLFLFKQQHLEVSFTFHRNRILTSKYRSTCIIRSSAFQSCALCTLRTQARESGKKQKRVTGSPSQLLPLLQCL